MSLRQKINTDLLLLVVAQSAHQLVVLMVEENHVEMAEDVMGAERRSARREAPETRINETARPVGGGK